MGFSAWLEQKKWLGRACLRLTEHVREAGKLVAGQDEHAEGLAVLAMVQCQARHAARAWLWQARGHAGLF